MDDDSRAAPEGCVSTQTERGSPILPTGTNRWVGSSPLGVGAGLDWLTCSLAVPLLAAVAGLKSDTAGCDGVGESTATQSLVNACGGYKLLGPSSQHKTQWYGQGVFADDGSWDVQRDGHGKNAGSVVLTLRGALLARLPDRGLEACRSLTALGVRMRRSDIMAEAPLVPGALYELYQLLRRGTFRLPRGLTFEWRDDNGRSGSLYLGSKASAEYVCLYDRRGVDRVEVRGRGEVAEMAVRTLLESGDPRTFVSTRMARYGPVMGSVPGQALMMALGASDAAGAALRAS